MKNKFFLLLGITVLMFSACSKNNESEIDPTSGDKAYVSFSIAMPSGSGTKVDNATHQSEYQGTTNEQAIKAVRVVLYNTSGIVKYSFDLAATTDGTSPVTGTDVAGTGTVSSFTSKGKEIDVANYQILVFINPTQAITAATTTLNTLSDIKTAVTATASSFTSSSTGFLMSNADGLVTLSGTSFSGNTTATSAEANAIAVNVERAVAQIFVGIGASGIDCKVEGATVGSTVKWYPNVTNKKTFWVRELANAVNGSMETSATSRANRYAKDPNWTGFRSKDVATLKAEFNYLTNASASSFVNVGYAAANGIYVLENTMDAADQYTQVTTTAIVELTFTPNGITTGASWFLANGKVYSVSAFKTLFQQAIEELINGNTDEIVNHPVGFKACAARLYESLSGITNLTGVVYDGDYLDDELTTGFQFNGANASTIEYFHNGINYYDVLIRHFDDVQQPISMEYGRYGVVRNNIYRLDLESVSDNGRPTIVPEPKEGDEPTPGPTPGPDDKDKGYISAKVTVLPWIVRTQPVDLK